MSKSVIKNRCSKCGSIFIKPYALYELRDDGTKIWRTNLCSKCDSLIAKNNNLIKVYSADKVFVEV
jgi:ribosomal protein S27AE